MNFHLRAATEGDADAVASILIRARAAFMPYARPTHSETDIRVWVRQDLLRNSRLTVAECERSVVGVVAASTAGGYSWVDQLSVDPGRAGRGIGSALLGHALATLPPPVRLYTFQANVGARRFYE